MKYIFIFFLIGIQLGLAQTPCTDIESLISEHAEWLSKYHQDYIQNYEAALTRINNKLTNSLSNAEIEELANSQINFRAILIEASFQTIKDLGEATLNKSVPLLGTYSAEFLNGLAAELTKVKNNKAEARQALGQKNLINWINNQSRLQHQLRGELGDELIWENRLRAQIGDGGGLTSGNPVIKKLCDFSNAGGDRERRNYLPNPYELEFEIYTDILMAIHKNGDYKTGVVHLELGVSNYFDDRYGPVLINHLFSDTRPLLNSLKVVRYRVSIEAPFGQRIMEGMQEAIENGKRNMGQIKLTMPVSYLVSDDIIPVLVSFFEFKCPNMNGCPEANNWEVVRHNKRPLKKKNVILMFNKEGQVVFHFDNRYPLLNDIADFIKNSRFDLLKEFSNEWKMVDPIVTISNQIK